MAGFIRRYPYFPGNDVITLIEGAIIIDAPPPGLIQGVQSGVACLVGEFADVTYGISVDATGNVTTKPQPVEVFSSQDMLNKVGGFDETLGEFGVSDGSGFTALRNKTFSRLILVPVNLASAKAIRLFRQLPTNAGPALATPVVPMQGATVAAGRQFVSGSSRVRVCKSVVFTSDQAYEIGTDGDVAAAGSPAPTQDFSAASGVFTTFERPDGKIGVEVGDALVLGQIGGAGGLGADAGTYRVTAVGGDTSLTVEKMDGTSFDWTSATGLPWRIHPGIAADSAVPGYSLLTVNGYGVPARPLDAAVAHDVLLTPSVVPTAPTQTSWDSLSSLGARTQPGAGNDLTYTSAVQAPNAVSSASIDALYVVAFNALLADSYPARDVNILWAARTSANIRTALNQHVNLESGSGVGRICCISPEINQVTESIVLGDVSPGVGANRSERVLYAWPGAQTYVPEAVGFNLKTAIGTLDPTGQVDQRLDGWLAAVLSNLPPEQNPAQSGPPVSTVMAGINAFQRGAPSLSLGDYIAFRQRGVVALRIDTTAGAIFQSGITTSLTSGEKRISRRRMADFIEDSVAQRIAQFAGKLMTRQLQDAAVGEVNAFLDGLLSPNNPPAQRIAAYSIDSKSGNTPESLAQGIYVIIGKVRTLASADFLVFQASIGESVNVTIK